MTILFFIFVALVVFHFIYDGILAPSFRYRIRLELFEIRDGLRNIKIEQPDEFSDELFEDLQKGVNKQIAFLHRLNLSELVKMFIIIENDKDIDAKVERLNRMLYECKIPEVDKLRSRSLRTLVYSILVNTGGWSVFVIPTVLFVTGFYLFINKVRKLANQILEIPERELQTTFSSDVVNA